MTSVSFSSFTILYRTSRRWKTSNWPAKYAAILFRQKRCWRRSGLPTVCRISLPSFPAASSNGVAIARAIAKNPKILLCDEPTGALDYVTGKSILSLLQNTCRNTGKTVIVITHNQALTAMADRVIRVKSGKIISNIVNDAPVPVEQIEW